MTISEAYRNRGLLVYEMQKPVYRVTYGRSRYDKQTAIFKTAGSWQEAKQDLTEQWEKYADSTGIPRDSVIEIHCIANG
jgi:hypothetical protein